MLLTPLKVGDKLFNLPIIALTAHFKDHRSFDHEHSLPLVGIGLITLIETRSSNDKNGKIKKKIYPFCI